MKLLGVSQFEAMPDPLQPALDAVDPPRLTGEVTVQAGNPTLQVGDGAFEGRQPPLHVAHILPHLVHPRTDDAEVIEHQAFDAIGYYCKIGPNHRHINQPAIARW